MVRLHITVEREVKEVRSQATETRLPSPAPRSRHKLTPKNGLFIGVGVLIVFGLTGVGVFRNVIWKPPVLNPFSNTLSASLQFPLYHPTYVPNGYSVNAKSVTEPTTGVVVFTISNANNDKIYISEEARPQKYDIGGFFKEFSNLKETAIPGGAIATGTVSNGGTEIASMLNNKVWIIANTTSHLQPSQLYSLVKGLSSNVANN